MAIYYEGQQIKNIYDEGVQINNVYDEGQLVYQNSIDFSPLDLYPIAYYDFSNSSTITVINGRVSNVNDLSGNGYNLKQSNTLNRPLYQNGVLYFDSNIDETKYLYDENNLASNLTDTFQIFTVSIPIYTDSINDRSVIINFSIDENIYSYRYFTAQIWTDKSYNPRIPLFGGNGVTHAQIYVEANNTENKTSLLTTNGNNTTKIYNVTYENDEERQELTSTMLYGHTAVKFGLGSINYNKLVGYVNEVIVFDNQLSTENTTKIEDYLKNKWNII